MSILKVDYGDVGGGGEASGSFTSSDIVNKSITIQTGLSQVKRFYFVGTIMNDSANYGLTILYDDSGIDGTGTKQSVDAVYYGGAVSQSASQSILTKNNYITSATQCAYVSDITNGNVTINTGSSGTWNQLSGTWYAYDH